MNGWRRTARDRGQTTQDYAIGIGLFLLVVVFVVTFLPSVLAPFDSVDETERSSQAERVAIEVLEQAGVEDQRLTLDSNELDRVFSLFNDSTAFGLPEHRSVNATLAPLASDGTIISGGDEYAGDAAGTWTRIVTTTDGCDPGCRLVVRVW